MVIHLEGRDEASARVLASLSGNRPPEAIAEIPAAVVDLRALARARASDRNGVAVIIDGAAGQIHAVRLSDGLVVSRAAVAELFASPYAVSLAAAELSRLLEEAPPPSPLESQPAAVVGAGDTPDRAVGPDDPTAAGVMLGPAAEIGAGIAGGLGSGAMSFGVRAAAGISLDMGPWYVSTHLAGAMYAQQSVPVTTAHTGALELRHRRTDTWLRGSFGRRDPHAEIAGELHAGVSFTGVRLVDSSGNLRGGHDGHGLWAGVGLALRRPIGFGMSVGLSLGLDWALSPTRYLVGGVVAHAEARIRARTSLELAWSN